MENVLETLDFKLCQVRTLLSTASLAKRPKSHAESKASNK
jgi:hypothetical protein